MCYNISNCGCSCICHFPLIIFYMESFSRISLSLPLPVFVVSVSLFSTGLFFNHVRPVLDTCWCLLIFYSPPVLPNGPFFSRLLSGSGLFWRNRSGNGSGQGGAVCLYWTKTESEAVFTLTN